MSNLLTLGLFDSFKGSVHLSGPSIEFSTLSNVGESAVPGLKVKNLNSNNISVHGTKRFR